jgi:hypothetical protein
MARRLLLVLPAIAVGIVLWTLLTAGAPRAVDTVRVLGGPTWGISTLSWLVSVSTLDDGRRSPSPGRPLRVLVRAGNVEREWTGVSDADGHAEARVTFATPLVADPWVRVEARDTGALLVEGTLSAPLENWQKDARREGGWLPGRASGDVALRVAPLEGTLAVPFPAELVIEARRVPPASAGNTSPAALPAPGLELGLELEGGERMPTPDATLLTDAQGRARVLVRPLEHAIRLQVTAHARASPDAQPTLVGQWTGALPVLAGALHASLEGAELRVRSPIAADTAFVSLITERERLAGYILGLAPDADGLASGRLELEAPVLARLRDGPAYAVVSSAYDKRSPSAVGWPLFAAAPAASALPAHTFAAPDQLLLDGSERALARELELRRGRRRLAALGLGLVGAALLVAFGYSVRRRASHAADGPGALDLASQRWAIGLALGCIVLAVAALIFFALWSR